MTTPIPPDDRLDPDELTRRLLALVEGLPRMLHEQVGALKAETDVILELQQGLEKTVNAENAEIVQLSKRMVEAIDRLNILAVRATVANAVQNSILQLLSAAAFDDGFAEAVDREWAREQAKRMVSGLSEIHSWSNENRNADAALGEFIDRVFPEGGWPAPLPPPT